MTNTGTLNFYSSAAAVSGGGTFQNSGTVALLNPGSTSQYTVISDAITGSGTIALGEHARIEISGAVAAGQSILLNDGSSGNQIVQLDNVGTFQRNHQRVLVQRPDRRHQHRLYRVHVYQHRVELRNADHPGTAARSVGTINFSGQYSQSSFSLVYNNFGSGQSNLQISTSVVNAQSGGLPPGYSSGGNGSLPVLSLLRHRFRHSTCSRRASAKHSKFLSTRPDLTEETNNFGAVSSKQSERRGRLPFLRNQQRHPLLYREPRGEKQHPGHAPGSHLRAEQHVL